MTATISLALSLTTWLSAPVSLDKDPITAAEARAHLGEKRQGLRRGESARAQCLVNIRLTSPGQIRVVKNEN